MLPRGIKRSFESENSPESRNLSDIDSEEVRQNQNFLGECATTTQGTRCQMLTQGGIQRVKVLVIQSLRPNFDPQNSHSRRQLTPESCPLRSTLILWNVYTQTLKLYTQTYIYTTHIHTNKLMF